MTTPLPLAAANFSLRYPAERPEFCAQHGCKGTVPSCCPTPCAAPAEGTPHLLYMHVEKTGGSSIECAWQQAAERGHVDLLGHADGRSHAVCAVASRPGGGPYVCADRAAASVVRLDISRA